MDIKKFIIPGIVVIVLGGLAGVIFYMNYKSHQFTIPGRETVEAEIRTLGYDIGEPEEPIENFGPKNYTGIFAVEKGEGAYAGKYVVPADVDFTFREYNSKEAARKDMSTYYYYAEFLEEKKGNDGKVNIYYNEKNDICYVAYDMNIKSDGKLENFIMNASSGHSLFEDPDVHYIYGGVYMDGKRLVNITTTNPKKAYEIGKAIGNLGLPKPR